MVTNNSKSSRGLTAEERGLWARTMRDVRPGGAGGKNAESKDPHHHRPAVPENEAVDTDNNGKIVGSGRHALGIAGPSITGRRSLRRIKRGQPPIEAHLDLHGYTLQQAYRVLVAFLRNSHIRGHRCVLVITGKALRSQDPRTSLKAQVPKWLSAAHLRPFVLSSATAGLRHGGGGALYVMVRRRTTRVPGR